MTRKSGLASAGTLNRKAYMSKAPTRRLAESRGTFADASAVVAARDGYKCALCGEPGTQVHHRLPRQAGGSSRSTGIHLPGNLVLLCQVCHDYAEDHRRPWALERGLLIRRGLVEAGEQVPIVRRVPVLGGFQWVTLGNDGRIYSADNGPIPERCNPRMLTERLR